MVEFQPGHGRTRLNQGSVLFLIRYQDSDPLSLDTTLGELQASQYDDFGFVEGILSTDHIDRNVRVGWWTVGEQVGVPGGISLNDSCVRP